MNVGHCGMEKALGIEIRRGSLITKLVSTRISWQTARHRLIKTPRCEFEQFADICHSQCTSKTSQYVFNFFSLSFDDFIRKNVQMMNFRRVYNQLDSVTCSYDRKRQNRTESSIKLSDVEWEREIRVAYKVAPIIAFGLCQLFRPEKNPQSSDCQGRARALQRISLSSKMCLWFVTINSTNDVLGWNNRAVALLITDSNVD